MRFYQVKITKHLSERNLFILALFWTIAITIASLVSLSNMPRVNVLGKDKTVHVGEDGETIQITGTSNSSKLTFSWSTNEIGIPNVTSFTVNSDTSATSGTAITGDPGATAQYTFKVSIVVPKNNTTDNRDSVLKVTCNTTSITDNFTISQMAGAAYLYLNSTGTTTASITIPQNGTPQTVNVLSNTDWTFE